MTSLLASHPCRHVTANLIQQVAACPVEDVAMAIRILARIGPPVVELLLAAAARPGTPVIGVYRLLVLAQQIGGDHGLVENHYLLRLRRHWCAAVRLKAEEALVALRQRRRSHAR